MRISENLEVMLDDSWVIVESSEGEDSQNCREEDKEEREEERDEEREDWTGQKWCKYV